MSSTIIWNLVLIVPFLLAFIGLPLWMSIRHPDLAPEHTAARRYLAAKGTPIVSTGRGALDGVAARPRATASEREPVLAGR